MLLLPAIDLMGGFVVRLQRGDPNAKTVYSKDPVAFALRWEANGGDWLHLVDLDAAFSGTNANLDAVASICAAVGIPCELGGGMRTESAIESSFAAGVRRAVIGTRAAESLDFVSSMVRRFGSDRIAVGIDARDGMVAVKGWKEVTALKAVDLAGKVADAGAGTIIYTDIATDGMLTGPNLSALQEIASAVDIPVIASGGVSCVKDLRDLEGLGCVHGAIIGKALYDGKIEGHLRRALELEDLG